MSNHESSYYGLLNMYNNSTDDYRNKIDKIFVAAKKIDESNGINEIFLMIFRSGGMDFREFIYMINNGVDLSSCVGQVFVRSCYNDTSITEYILQNYSFDFDECSREAFFAASISNNKKTAKLLLDHGLQVDRWVMEYAANSRYIVDLLLEYNVDISEMLEVFADMTFILGSCDIPSLGINYLLKIYDEKNIAMNIDTAQKIMDKHATGIILTLDSIKNIDIIRGWMDFYIKVYKKYV